MRITECIKVVKVEGGKLRVYEDHDMEDIRIPIPIVSIDGKYRGDKSSSLFIEAKRCKRKGCNHFELEGGE